MEGVCVSAVAVKFWTGFGVRASEIEKYNYAIMSLIIWTIKQYHSDVQILWNALIHNFCQKGGGGGGVFEQLVKLLDLYKHTIYITSYYN